MFLILVKINEILGYHLLISWSSFCVCLH